MRYCILKMEDYIILFFDVEHSFIYPWWTSTPEKSWWLVGWFWRRVYMDVSENSGNYPPNHPILIGFSIKKTIHFGVFPYFWKHPSLEIRSFTSGTSQVYVYIGDSDVNDVDGSLLGSQLFWVKQNQEKFNKILNRMVSPKVYADNHGGTRHFQLFLGGTHGIFFPLGFRSCWPGFFIAWSMCFVRLIR